ncbi:diguanylate cyclase [Desulfonema ishimotonii]|uniref:diguanylate cyclase n=1 Tax=Desulfonema ishimotonii TaxID=45657 RepID=A0A401FTD6_9BACT|nr:diguanylate cyclase [Desulfonema ishimotonii]GBC60225.1 diguanylate cyclase [Desulfonema ishimotonii]
MSDEQTPRYKILIVDDVPKNIQIVANILQNQGYSMAFAQSGDAALELTRTNPFDLILLDIMMPDMDGFEVCKRLRENPSTRHVPILFLTAKTDTESVVRGFETGGMDYVIKPVKEAELLARVRTHLELYRSRRKLQGINARLSREITERRQAERRYRSFYENAVQGMFQSTFSGQITTLNPAYAHILGYGSPEEVIALENVGEVFYENPADRVKMIEALRVKGMLTNYELKILKKDGSPAWIMVNARLVKYDPDGDPMIEGIVIEHTAQKLAEEKLRLSREKFRHQATHDNLTGLYNTRYLYHALDRLIRCSAEEGSRFSLIFTDVDNFKRVVDTYGHLKGSRTLQEMAKTVQDCIEEPAYGVAYGGDEFVVVLPGLDKAGAIRKAEEIRNRIRETPYLTGQGHEVYIRASFGVATYPEDASDVNGLLALADQAMFNVKGEGKDAVRASGEQLTVSS